MGRLPSVPGRRSGTPPGARAVAIGRGAVLLAPLALTLAVFVPLTPAYDLDVFLRAGHAVAHGMAVYPAPRSAAVYSGSSFVYPFVAALPFVPLAALPSGLATDLFFAFSALALVGATLLATEGRVTPAVLLLCTSFTITGLQLGALSPLLGAGAVLLWRLRDRPTAVAMLAAVLITSKLFLAPLLLWLLITKRHRALAGASVLTGVLLGVGFALGPLGPFAYLTLLSGLGVHEARSGFGLIGALMNVGLAASVAQVLAAFAAAAVLAAVCVVYRRKGEERIVFVGALVISLLLSPVVWSHYFILVGAALLVLGAPLRWFVALALASWAIAPPHGVQPRTDLLGITSSGSWILAAVTMALLETLVRLARRRVGVGTGG